MEGKDLFFACLLTNYGVPIKENVIMIKHYYSDECILI